MKYLIIVLLTILVAACKSVVEVDLVLENGVIYTVDKDFSVYESIAITDGKIVDIGTSEEIGAKYLADSIVDVKGSYIYPGFNDAHCHFYGLAKNTEFEVDLKYSESFDEVVDRVNEFVKEHDYTWIVGRGWDQNDWLKTDFPDNTTLNKLYPETPVVLIRVDGHAVLANEKALSIAGITTNTKFEGGEVFVSGNTLTGLLLDKAADHVKEQIPPPDRNQIEGALLSAQENCIAAGLTSLTDAGLDKDIILLIDQMHQKGKLKLRINAMINPTEENYEYFMDNGMFVTEKLRVGSIKLYADGALGSRGACLLDSYSDDPGNFGLIIDTISFYQEICKKAFDAGYQVSTHAIGDSAVRMILNIYKEYLEPNNDLRWRIEHAQLVNPVDLSFFGKYAIIPSIQSTHATSDMPWAVERLGSDRLSHAYCYNDLLKQNGWLPNGTDFPIEEIYPLYSFYAAIARKDMNGLPEKGFQIKNALDRKSALRSITIWPSKASFEENRKGSLEVGKCADLVVLDKNIMEIDELLIPDTKVKMTIINGEIVYKNDN